MTATLIAGGAQPVINVDRDVDTLIGTIGQNAQVSFIRNRLEMLPESVQSDIEIQRIATEIEDLEKSYLPVFQDFYATRLTTNPERYVLLLMAALFVIGVGSGIDLILCGLISLVLVVAGVGFYFRVQWLVHRDAKSEMVVVKKLLRGKLYEFADRQMQLMKPKNVELEGEDEL